MCYLHMSKNPWCLFSVRDYLELNQNIKGTVRNRLLSSAQRCQRAEPASARHMRTGWAPRAAPALLPITGALPGSWGYSQLLWRPTETIRRISLTATHSLHIYLNFTLKIVPIPGFLRAQTCQSNVQWQLGTFLMILEKGAIHSISDV